MNKWQRTANENAAGVRRTTYLTHTVLAKMSVVKMFPVNIKDTREFLYSPFVSVEYKT